MQEFWIRFKANLSLAFSHAETWVISIWSVVGLYWQTMMTDVEKADFLAAMPFGLGRFLPIAIFAITYFAAHGWPQPKLEDKLEVSKIETDLKVRAAALNQP